MFRTDDIIIKEQVDYKDPGRTGNDVLWDFSSLSVINEEYKLQYSSENDTVITGIEHLTQYQYVLQNDSLLLLGYKSQSTELNNKQPELLLKFPLVFGDKTKSYYYGHGKHGNRLEMDAMGSVETEADAYGIMILPNKDTLKNVLRTHSLKYIAENTKPVSDEFQEKENTFYYISPDSIDFRLANDSALFVVETFRWYEKGYRYPVFETVRSWEKRPGITENTFLNTAFFYPPQEHYYLDDDEENLALLEETEDKTLHPWDGLTYNIFPNPVKTFLDVEIALPYPAKVKVQLRTATGNLYLNENKGNFGEGICRFRIDVSRFPVDNYVLSIGLNDYVISEIIMKR
ncbi:hypothetical protein FACS1894123_06420 [Bacteroidia bacterium]|nr:hypothetical protein FACS1894123_06420 [Bacteroidia bacterium]